MKSKILIVDDEESIRYTFDQFLTEAGYEVETADSMQACLEKVRQEPFDLLFLDINLGEENGLDALDPIRKLQPECSIVMITGAFSSKSVLKARIHGASDYLAKPIRKASLLYVAGKELSMTRSRNRADEVSH